MDRLIELVREHPSLYDTHDVNYVKLCYKEQIWDEIADKLGLESGQEAKEQWLSLRQCHRDAIRRRKRIQKPIKPWTYQYQMEFLLPYMSNRNFNYSMDSSIQMADSRTNNENILDDDAEMNFNDNVEEIEMYDELDDTDEPKRKKLKPSADNDNIYVLEMIRNYEKKIDERNASIKEIMGKIRKLEADNDDPMFQFFKSMFLLTKKLPTQQQLQIRKAIYNTVHDAEEHALLESQKSPKTNIMAENVKPPTSP